MSSPTPFRLAFFSAILICISGLCLYGADRPFVVVLDPVSKGLSGKEKDLVVDLFTTILYSSGKCNPVSRVERNRLLLMNRYPVGKNFGEEEFDEAARIFFADYIVSGSIAIDRGECRVRFGIFDTNRMSGTATVEKSYGGFDEFIRDSLGICGSLLGGISVAASRVEERVADALGPVPVKEKILFVFKAGPLSGDEAACRDALYRTVGLLGENFRFISLAVELESDSLAPRLDAMIDMAARRGSNYIAYIRKTGEDYVFTLSDKEGKELFAVSMGSAFEPEEQAKKINETLAGLPNRDINTLVKAIEKNILLEEKIDVLLATRKTVERRLALGVSGKVFKSAFVPFLQPLLNLFSLETNAMWFYDEHFGIGAGYGFSIDFPGTFDQSLENHPRIYQHEIKVYPLCYRTGGDISFVANVIAAVTIHNMYFITTYINGSPTYEDIGYLAFVKAGINLGFTIFISEDISLSVDCVTVYLALPIVPHPQNNVPLSFSGDLVGLGLTFNL